jgi:hypothetical protein
LGLNDFNKNGLSFYPNPAKTEIFIKNSTNSTLTTLKIVDLTGKLVLSKAMDTTESSAVNIATLAAGLYLIAIEDTIGNQYQSKLIIE